jgi:hypothetical protein
VGAPHLSPLPLADTRESRFSMSSLEVEELLFFTCFVSLLCPPCDL